MLFNIRVCNAGWHPIRTSAVYSDFDPPGTSSQMLPWGKLIQEYFAWQNEASDLNVGCLFLCGNVFSLSSHHILYRSGENRQLFRSAKMTPGSRFLTTPTPLLTASDFRQTKRPAYHTQIVQYTGHSGYSLRHWYSWSHASAFQCQRHPGTPVSKVTHCCFLYSHLTIQCALYQSSWCWFSNQGFLSGHRHCRVRKPYFLMTIDTNITSLQDFLY